MLHVKHIESHLKSDFNVYNLLNRFLFIDKVYYSNNVFVILNYFFFLNMDIKDPTLLVSTHTNRELFQLKPTQSAHLVNTMDLGLKIFSNSPVG